MKTLICLAAALALPSFAHAEGLFKKKVAPTFCASALEVSRNVDECESNDAFVAEGEKCLDKLEAESKAVSKEMGNAFDDNLALKQSAKFGAADQDYNTTTSALAFLISTAKLARSEIETYKWNLAWPADYDEEEVTSGDYKTYFMNVECYGKNRENLDSILADFDSRLKKLELAKAGAEARALASRTRKGAIEVSSLSDQPLLKRAPATTGKPVLAKKRFEKHESTITGEISKPELP